MRNTRNYLVVHSVVDGPYIADPVADFTYEADVDDPLKIVFTNTSTNAVSYCWDFRDKSSSTDENPTHTYARSGTYNVKLTVQNIAGVSDTVTQTITVIANPVAGFTYRANAGNSLIIGFTNTSTDAVSYSWDFGDGSPAESARRPMHTYAEPGTYTVTLTAQNTVGAAATVTQNITVSPTPPAPVTYTVTLPKASSYTAAFVAGSSSPAVAGSTVNFTVAAEEGYVITSVFEVTDGIYTLTAVNGVYTINEIAADTTISVQAAPIGG